MQPSHTKHRQRGVTLLELMAVVVVIGILGAIAIPSYRQYVMRAQRVEAKNALLQLATNQERYYIANRTYGTVAQLIAANLLPADGLSERDTYQITLAPHASGYAVGYTATATPIAGGQVDMRDDSQCTTFSITEAGVRAATGADPASCW